MNQRKLKEMSVEVIVGAFLFLVLGGLGVFTIALSKENLLAKTYEQHVIFDEVQGLRAGDNVLMRGVNVGRVKSLFIEQEGVHVILSLSQPIRLHENYRIEIVPSSILGGQYVGIYPGTMQQPLLAEDYVAQGQPPTDLVKQASEAVAAFREALVDGGVLDNLKSTMAQLDGITSKLEQGEGTMGKLLTDDEIYGDLKTTMTNLRDVSDRLNNGEGLLAKLLSDDDTVYANLEETSANFKEVSERLAHGEGTLARLLSDDDTLYQDLEEIASNLKQVSGRLAEGEGTLGKLATDDQLYEDARLLMAEVRAAVDDLRESAPIVTFTSVFFGAL